MNPSLFVAGFALGAAGSLHCIGMCGPLSLALPTFHLSPLEKFFSLLLYQFGRIITYSVLGFILGLAGRSIAVAGFQNGFSIAAGSTILLFALFYFIHKHSFRIPFFHRLYYGVQKSIAKILKSYSGRGAFLALGMANGLLPCGMVYVAAAASLSLPGPLHGTAFMAMFGAGTLPVMLLFGYGSQLIKPELRVLFRKVVPFFITAMGVILILRGLNLGIPFISPQLPEAPGHVITCSH